MLQRIALFGCLISGGCDQTVMVRNPPAEQCGNGVVEASEACDDGNTVDDDGGHRWLSGGSLR